MLNLHIPPTPASNTLTPEQFLFWLRGFLEAHPDPHVAADRIAAKAKEVQVAAPYVSNPWTLSQPAQVIPMGAQATWSGVNIQDGCATPPEDGFFRGHM